jgi:hypothetical protein
MQKHAYNSSHAINFLMFYYIRNTIMTKHEMKQYQNVSMYDIIGASILGATIGTILALVYIGGF